MPVSQLGFSSTPCPPGIELGSFGITVTTPANFPLPGGKKLVQELQCQGLEVRADGGTYQLASRITVRAATWQQAWALVAPSAMVNLLSPGSFAIQNGVATVSRRVSSATFFPDDVIAVQNGASLQPLLFQKTLTPWTLRDGENRFYLHTFFGGLEFHQHRHPQRRGDVDPLLRHAHAMIVLFLRSETNSPQARLTRT